MMMTSALYLKKQKFSKKIETEINKIEGKMCCKIFGNQQYACELRCLCCSAGLPLGVLPGMAVGAIVAPDSLLGIPFGVLGPSGCL